MNRNNVKLKLTNGALLSIAQHYDDSGEMLCSEIAIITEKGVSDPLPFFPNVSDFMKTFSQVIQGAGND
jgi:hypothetical protein